MSFGAILSGAAAGVGQEWSERREDVKTRANEAFKMKMEKYKNDLGAPDRQAGRDIQNRQIDATEASNASQDKYRQGSLVNDARAQSYKEFDDGITALTTRVQGVEDWYADQAELGTVTPEITAQYETEKASLQKAWQGLVTANPDFAEKRGYGRKVYGSLGSDKVTDTAAEGDTPPPKKLGYLATLKQQSADEARVKRTAKSLTDSRAKIDSRLSELEKRDPSTKLTQSELRASSLMGIQNPRHNSELIELDKILEDANATGSQKRKAKRIIDKLYTQAN